VRGPPALVALVAALVLGCSTGTLEPGEVELDVREVEPPADFIPSATISVAGSTVKVEGLVSGSLACGRLEGSETRTGTKLTFQVRSIPNGQGCPPVVRALEFEGEMKDIVPGDYTFSVEHLLVGTEDLVIVPLTAQPITIR
jgi:hypothetical protein